MPGFGQGVIRAPGHRPGVVTVISSVVLRQSRRCRRDSGKWHILRDPPPDTCQWLRQLVILSDEYLPPPQLLPVASTLGAQSPGCFRAPRMCGPWDVSFPFSTTLARLCTSGDGDRKKGPTAHLSLPNPSSLPFQPKAY